MVLITSSQHGSTSQFAIIVPGFVQTLGYKPSIFRTQIALLGPVDPISSPVGIRISPQSWTKKARVHLRGGPRNYSPVLRFQARPGLYWSVKLMTRSHLFPRLGIHGIIHPLPHTGVLIRP